MWGKESAISVNLDQRYNTSGVHVTDGPGVKGHTRRHTLSQRLRLVTSRRRSPRSKLSAYAMPPRPTNLSEIC